MEGLRAMAVIATALFCAPIAAQTAPPLNPEQPPAIVHTGPPIDNRVTIPIHIDGKGPWHFIIDTGSQRTVISRDLAERLALSPRDPVTIVSMTGRSAANTVAVPRLAFGSSLIDDIEAPVLEGHDLGAAGLLGLDSLHAKRLLLDFRAGRMEISSSRTHRREARESDAIVVEAQRRRGQLILLNSTVNGMRVNIVLDTGTAFSVGNLALRDKLIRKKRAPALMEASLVSVDGGVLTGQVGLIGPVRMGLVNMKDLPVLFADASPFDQLGLRDKPALLLGINALRVFDRVAIDFGRGKVDFLLPDSGAIDGLRLATTETPTG